MLEDGEGTVPISYFVSSFSVGEPRKMSDLQDKRISNIYDDILYNS